MDRIVIIERRNNKILKELTLNLLKATVEINGDVNNKTITNKTYLGQGLNLSGIILKIMLNKHINKNIK